MNYPQHATIAEIDLDNLRYNYRNIKQHVAPSELISVVKANAYGHVPYRLPAVCKPKGRSILPLPD
jgi:alanine racemase